MDWAAPWPQAQSLRGALRTECRAQTPRGGSCSIVRSGLEADDGKSPERERGFTVSQGACCTARCQRCCHGATDGTDPRTTPPMIDVADIIQFPETPEEMHRLLQIEAKAKHDGGLATNGLSGYIVYMWRELRMTNRNGGDISGVVEGRVLLSDRHAAGSRSADDAGVSVR